MSTAGETSEDVKLYTKEELKGFICDIETQIVENNVPTIHAMLALNHIMHSANAHEIVDDAMKQQLRDIWSKVKASGLHIADPPSLFGIPPLPEEIDEEEAEGNGAA